MDSFNIESFFNSEAFNSLEAGNKELLREFAERASGKSQADAVAIFMEYRGRLSVDPQTQKMLLDVLKAGLSAESRKRLELMETFMLRGGL